MEEKSVSQELQAIRAQWEAKLLEAKARLTLANQRVRDTLERGSIRMKLLEEHGGKRMKTIELARRSNSEEWAALRQESERLKGELGHALEVKGFPRDFFEKGGTLEAFLAAVANRSKPN